MRTHYPKSLSRRAEAREGKPEILNGLVVGVDGTKYRQTPDGEKTVPDILQPGDIVKSSYGTGPYQIKSVKEYTVCACPVGTVDWGPDTPREHDTPACYPLKCFGLVLVDVGTKSKNSNKSYINELVAVGDRILKLFEDNTDEVFLIKKGPALGHPSAEPDRYFCHPIAGDWTKHPLPDPNPMITVQDIPNAMCGLCPLASCSHVMVPVEGKPHSYTKYCTITAIAAGLVDSSEALSDGQAPPTKDEMLMVDVLVDRFTGGCANCQRKLECIRQPIGPDAECLAKRDRPRTWVDAVAPEPEETPLPAAPEPAATSRRPAPDKPCCLFGWMSGSTDSHGPQQLYVQRHGKDWGVTYDPTEATRFKSVNACIDFWGRIHSFPENYEQCIYNGYLQFFEYGPAGLRQMPRLTRQGSLFDIIEPGDWDQPVLPKVK